MKATPPRPVSPTGEGKQRKPVGGSDCNTPHGILALLVLLALGLGLGLGLGLSRKSSPPSASPVVNTPTYATVAKLSVPLTSLSSAAAVALRCDVASLLGMNASSITLVGYSNTDSTQSNVQSTDPVNTASPLIIIIIG